MTKLDWLVLIATITLIVVYGIWKGRRNRDMQDYLLASRSLPWYIVCLSIMGTQASAITFLSAPGQAYGDGMRFVQFYFGLPLAMVVLSITAVPIYHKLHVYTAYEYLESRFDLKTRTLAATLFLIQRGISTGVSIYAPAIVLSSILGWSVQWTCVLNGILVLLYTVSGGTKAVSYTQLTQMIIILSGMAVAGFLTVQLLPPDITFADALRVAGKADKLNVIDLKFDPNNQYNIWSGLIGGFFLSLSYFGADQSQVGRYLSGSSVTQSRLGLLMNGIVKIPMQFGILFIGAMVFVFYLFVQPPLFFNHIELDALHDHGYTQQVNTLQYQQDSLFKIQQHDLRTLIQAMRDNKGVVEAEQKFHTTRSQMQQVRTQVTNLIKQDKKVEKVEDTNYVFLSFVTRFLPSGLVGLLIAIVLLASMSSVAGALNSLTSTTIIDVYKRILCPDLSEARYLTASRWITVGWGVFSIVVALYAGQLGNLLEAVNRLGSLFYGVILGIFLCAFYIRRIRSYAVFYGAILAQITVFLLYWLTPIAFLWYNVIGCILVIIFAFPIELFQKKAEVLQESETVIE
ncbi:sodium:solute symporter [Cytophagaceae bacterium YF14B1]|uniref:Sodium:solute symporter n=1 Tax=Xanthocytophaga flava TaxID=3048013 RepID=A0AAE3QXH2_9BACT|nr:sodium:solute symporter [Xanthocytophaga flavus]MDJ1485360.1 sodium:solute symporter [Xanthocytophaga flavus]